MPTVRVTERKEIRRPIDVVRAHYGDIRHHMINNVHPIVSLEILRDHSEGCLFKQRSKVFGRERLDTYVLERRADGTVYLKVTEGPSLGIETFVSFRALGEAATEVTFTVSIPLPGLAVLIAPLARHVARRDMRTVLEEDRIDMEINGYQPAAA